MHNGAILTPKIKPALSRFASTKPIFWGRRRPLKKHIFECQRTSCYTVVSPIKHHCKLWKSKMFARNFVMIGKCERICLLFKFNALSNMLLPVIMHCVFGSFGTLNRTHPSSMGAGVPQGSVIFPHSSFSS